MALSLLIALSPFLLLISLLIKYDDYKISIFYKGFRTGLNDKPFRMYKFRTMKEGSELKGFSTSLNDERLTKIGTFLRKFKLDEFPQLINVLRGDMAIIGPRPQVSFYTDKYNFRLKRILSVKPGITDIASIYFSNMDKTLGTENVEYKYENEIEPIKNELRLAYVERLSPLLDLQILSLTFFTILGIKKIPFLKIKEINDLSKI